jgi:hypothetical protein
MSAIGWLVDERAGRPLRRAVPVLASAGHPWRRGSNENTNGLLREYFPKRSDLSATAPPTSGPWATSGS